jgi:hypothetical protein
MVQELDDVISDDDDAFLYKAVAYRDSCPDTTTARVNNVALLPCWIWMMFLIFMFLVEDLIVLFRKMIGC